MSQNPNTPKAGDHIMQGATGTATGVWSSLTVGGFEAEMAKRGFRFDATCNVWRGPHGITASPIFSLDEPTLRSTRSVVDTAFSRAFALQAIDEQLRAKRGLPRPPLVKPVNAFDTNFNPTIKPVDGIPR